MGIIHATIFSNWYVIIYFALIYNYNKKIFTSLTTEYINQIKHVDIL